MGVSKTEKGRVVEQYIAEYPNEFKKTLARRIVQDRPDLFKSVEEARGIIRYHLGASGDTSRKKKGALNGFEGIRDVMSKYALSSQEITSTLPFELPKAHNKIGLVSDIHLPYHDEKAIQTTFEYYQSEGINTIIINGDLVDFYQLSRFSKDPFRKDTTFEVNQTKEFFEFVRHIFPDVKLYWKLGNHEDRFEFYMRSNAKELMGLDDFGLTSIFSLNDYGVELIGSKQRIIAGQLNIVHGHEFGQSIFSPVNPARGLFLRAKANIIAGHNHQTSEHHENDINGNPVGCWSTGCLCHLNPEYRPFADTKWNHGAARIEIDKDGSFLVDNFRIINGKIR